MNGFLEVLHWLHIHEIDTVLAVLAIFFATIQFLDSRRQERRMKDIAQSMSTRFIGRFPHNMSEIIDVVGRAEGKLDILVNVSAYGHFSAPLQFRNYKRLIEDKLLNGCKVRMLLHTEDRYAKYREMVFSRETFTSEEMKGKLSQFLNVNPHLRKPEDWESFHALLADEQEISLFDFHRVGVELKVTESLLT